MRTTETPRNNNIYVTEIERKVIQIIKDTPGLLAVDIYSHFTKRWQAKFALKRLAKNGIVKHDGFKWYLEADVI